MNTSDFFPTTDYDDSRSLLTKLIDRSRLYHLSKNYYEFFHFVKKLPNFAPFNAFLLHMQKPGLRFAASESDWSLRFGRQIKEGARPLLILWPFGPVAFVYDIEDTFGNSLPKDIEKAFRAEGNLTEGSIRKFGAKLASKAIELRLLEYGDGKAGEISTEEGRGSEGLEIRKRSLNKREPALYIMRINSKHDPNVQFVTLTHELAHLYLGHLGQDKYLGIPERGFVKIAQAELEAESVAYLVCERNGVSSESERYLSHFVKTNEFIDSIDLYLVLRAAGQIESVLHLNEKVFQPAF